MRKEANRSARLSADPVPVSATLLLPASYTKYSILCVCVYIYMCMHVEYMVRREYGLLISLCLSDFDASGAFGFVIAKLVAKEALPKTQSSSFVRGHRLTDGLFSLVSATNELVC